MFPEDAVTMPAALHATHQAAPELDTTTEYLAFRLGTQEYGVDIMKVQEIRNYEAPVRMSGATASTPGLLSLRGEIITEPAWRNHHRIGPASPLRPALHD
jgi:purine-binding chemotaxis protein CheW